MLPLNKRSGALLFALATVAISAPVRAATQFVPSLALSAIYVDNIDLVPPGTEKTGDTALQLSPRLQFNQAGPRLVSALDYSAQALYFKDRSDLNAVYHSGRGNFSWTAAQNLFFIEGSASYQQQPVDLTQPRNTENLFAVSNVADEFNALLAPYLKHNFGETTGLLRYAVSTSRFINVPDRNATSQLQNSQTRLATGRLNSNDADAAVIWNIDGSSSRTTFETAQPFDSDRVSTGASVRLTNSLRANAAVGAETNVLDNSTTGGLNAGFWSTGVTWAPALRTQFEVEFGHRFFGDSYSLRWLQTTRLLKIVVNYDEQAGTDGYFDSTASFVPGEIPAAPVASANVSRSSSSYAPYIRKLLNASIAIDGRITHVSLQGYRSQRVYADAVAPGAASTTAGGELLLKRDIGVTASATMSYTIEYQELIGAPNFRDHRYEVNYARKLGERLEAKLRGVHLERDTAPTYQANIIMLTLTEIF